MTQNAAYRIGRFLGELPWWAKLALLLTVIAFFARGCSSQDSASIVPVAQTILTKERSIPTQTLSEDQERARAKQECESTIEKKSQTYADLMNQRKFWDAAISIRICADVIGTPDLRKLVRDAEVASHMVDINDPKRPLRDKAQAMQMLARDYPDIGAKFEAQATKLLAEADRKDQEREKKRKRSLGVTVGMTNEDALASSWGKPESINTTTTARGSREQWVYGGRSYLYFENGVLVAIQN